MKVDEIVIHGRRFLQYAGTVEGTSWTSEKNQSGRCIHAVTVTVLRSPRKLCHANQNQIKKCRIYASFPAGEFTTSFQFELSSPGHCADTAGVRAWLSLDQTMAVDQTSSQIRPSEAARKLERSGTLGAEFTAFTDRSRSGGDEPVREVLPVDEVHRSAPLDSSCAVIRQTRWFYKARHKNQENQLLNRRYD